MKPKQFGLPEAICDECGGGGQVGREVSMTHGDIGEITVDCHACNGKGSVDFKITQPQLETVWDALEDYWHCLSVGYSKGEGLIDKNQLYFKTIKMLKEGK